MNTAQLGIRQFELLIDGQTAPARSRGYFESINPSTGEVFARVADATKEDMERAIAAGRKAFDNSPWPRLTMAERGQYLKRIAQLIRENAKELAELETWDVGKTSKQSTFIDVPTCADTFEYFGNVGATPESPLQSRINLVDAPVKSLTAFEPRGVVGCIIPWNYPLIMAAWKMAPALIAGNTVVFKPSSVASVSIARLAHLMLQAGLPQGVVHIVTSSNHAVAAELVRSPAVDMISFTGGTQTGREIMRLAADTTKKVSLELGGKSPNIVFADCDLEAAIGGTMSAIFMNQGQMCTAGSRLLLEDKIYGYFLRTLVAKTRDLRIGDASSYETQFGPLVSREHRDKVLEYIKKGILEGAAIECGGDVPRNMGKGAYLEPTIFSDVTHEMTILREEIFGPVLCVIKFSEVEEAIRIANDTPYGLASMIWTKDLKKADAVAKKLQTGIVWINTYGGFYNGASFGGTKQSGFGRELGHEGLLEYTQSKHICLDQTPGGKPLVANWF